MEKFKIGVVGLRRGDVFVQLFSKYFEETEITALCDTDKKHVEDCKNAGFYPENAAIYDDYDAFLESGIDAVVLTNFFHEHASFAMKAMEKGIAVLSDTTAAPSLGECVDLVETAERTGTKYMLAANCLYFPNVHAMKKYVEDGSMGKVVSGNAEYYHPSDPNPEEVVDENNVHWRKFLPTCYYNMHTLGPLMYITGSEPVKVSCKATYMPEWCAEHKMYKDSAAAQVISEMDNGAIFNTTGCNGIFPTTKWYRLALEKGALETTKFSRDEDMRDLIVAKGHCDQLTTTRYSWVSSGIVDGNDYKEGTAETAGHGGIDYFIGYYFIKYLKGEYEPFLDVYRSVRLSANGILAWYSALSDSKEYKIPDFRKKEDRDKVRGDYRMPFAKRYKDLTLPCRIDEKEKFEGFEF